MSLIKKTALSKVTPVESEQPLAAVTASADRKLGDLIAGLTLEQSVRNAKVAHHCTRVYGLLNIAGEHYEDEALAHEDTRKYCTLVHMIHKREAKCSISIKPTQIGLGICKQLFEKNLDKIAMLAAEWNIAAVEVDMEMPETIHETVDVFCQVASKRNVLMRLAIPAEFRCSLDLAKRVVHAGAGVRLVRGKAYGNLDPSCVFDSDEELNNNFVEISKVVPLHKLAVATGNADLIRRVQDAVLTKDNVKDEIEYQFLVGLPHHEKVARKLVAEGKRVSMYMPCGSWHKVRGYVGRRNYLTEEEMKALDIKYHHGQGGS